MRLSAALVLAVALVVLPPGVRDAQACTSLRDWVKKYQRDGAPDRDRLDALSEMAFLCPDYQGVESDKALLAVLRDAVDRRYDRALIQQVYNTYRCLVGARDEAGHAALAERLSASRCPTEQDIAQWRTIDVDRASLREAAREESVRITTLPGGAVVQALRLRGDWMQVMTWGGRTGFIRADLLKPYLDDGAADAETEGEQTPED